MYKKKRVHKIIILFRIKKHPQNTKNTDEMRFLVYKQIFVLTNYIDVKIIPHFYLQSKYI